MKHILLKTLKLLGFKLFKIRVTNVNTGIISIHSYVALSELSAIEKTADLYSNADLESYTFKAI